MNELNKRYEFCLEIGGRTIFYKGLIIEITDNFYKINDYKNGEMLINKASVITMRSI